MAVLEADGLTLIGKRKIHTSARHTRLGNRRRPLNPINRDLVLSPFSRLSALRALRSVCLQIASSLLIGFVITPGGGCIFIQSFNARIFLFDGLRKSSSPPATQFGSGFLFPRQPPISLLPMIFTFRFQTEPYTRIHHHPHPSTPIHTGTAPKVATTNHILSRQEVTLHCMA